VDYLLPLHVPHQQIWAMKTLLTFNNFTWIRYFGAVT